MPKHLDIKGKHTIQASTAVSSPAQELPKPVNEPDWQRVCGALRQDWEHVMKEHVNPDRSRRDLTTPHHMSWDKAEPAIRFGYNAAYRYRTSGSNGLGSNALDRQLEAEWQQLRPGDPWQRVRPLVYRGWVKALINMR